MGKYFVDYPINTKRVTLNHFRARFHQFLIGRYVKDGHFAHWKEIYPFTDFRQHIVNQIDYLWKECNGLNYEYDPELEGLTEHPLWGETRPSALDAIPEEQSAFDKTVVTPYVYESFKEMPFVACMQVLEPANEAVQRARWARREQMKLTPLACPSTGHPQQIHRTSKKDICVGDVVCTEADKDSKWRSLADGFWYAYVQSVRVGKDGSRKLDVLWLYEPRDTTLGHGHFPFKNELFLSDNCSCGEDAIDADMVYGIVDVSWYAASPNVQCFFVRQKYRTIHEVGAYDFTTLRPSDFSCHCRSDRSDMDEVLNEYVKGDLVLFRQTIPEQQAESLEPAQITSFAPNGVTLRRFARCARDLGDDKAKANQVAFTDDLYHVAPSQIVRRCHVRLFPNIASISAPFSRDGAGDFFFIIPDRMSRSFASIPTLQHEPLPAESIQPPQKLKGLGLFCGGGNFDRGIEEGGAVDFHWAVDWAKYAMHTYRSNLSDPDATQLFLGSVNDYLAKANCGSQDNRIAQVGDVHLISAGSPCPGFSGLQLDKQSPRSLQNCSLVAAVMSHVDLFTPNYLILENVNGLADHPTDRPELNVFSQTLCCLVAMGYQVQQHLIDPISYGSCQSRARIFIIASAPGCVPINAPPHTHESGFYKSIGKMSNGLRFGGRRGDVSPFKAVSARQAMGDLPDISDSHVQTCIPFPDHRTSRSENSLTRGIPTMVPRWPHGLGFVQTVNMRNDPAINRTPMGKRQIEAAPWQNKHRASASSRAWARILPDGRIGCFTTKVIPADNFCGRVVHWDQPRLLTVIEARRTQGFLDSEVVIGIPTAQWKIIGNSVDRKVALALGLSLGQAWQQTLKDRGNGQSKVTNATKFSLEHATLGEDVQHSPEEDPIMVRGRRTIQDIPYAAKAYEISSRIVNLDLSSSIRSRSATGDPHTIPALATHIIASQPEDTHTMKSIKRSREQYDYGSDCFIGESTDTDAAADSQSSTDQENRQDEDSDCMMVGGMTRGGASTQASTEPSPEPKKRKVDGKHASKQWQSDSNESVDAPGPRRSNKKGHKQATRRAGGDGLIMPSNWAKKVERSIPAKVRRISRD